MLRTTTRLLAATAITLSLVVGTQPAQAASPDGGKETTGLLCKLLKISCP